MTLFGCFNGITLCAVLGIDYRVESIVTSRSVDLWLVDIVNACLSW